MTFNVHPVNGYKDLMVDGAVLVDVREPNEVAEGTIPGAINIPLGTLPDRVGDFDKNVPILLLCRSGGRSGKAAEYLVGLGFSSVTNLEGGMLAYAG